MTGSAPPGRGGFRAALVVALVLLGLVGVPGSAAAAAPAAWNSPTTAYGGYFGQNQFGPDPANRQNMNNYARSPRAG